ncbi:MAG: DUF4328 domain-containing protein [Pseudomonadota bacterium]
MADRLDGPARWTQRLYLATAIAGMPALLAIMAGETGYLPGIGYLPMPVLLGAGVVAIAYGVLALAASVWFLIWTFRAFRLAAEAMPGATDVTPGWAVGWYFVPIWFLWKPYIALRDIWTAALSAPVPALFARWWTTSVIAISSAILLEAARSFLLLYVGVYSVLIGDVIVTLAGVAVCVTTAAVVGQVTPLLNGRRDETVFA